MELTTNLQKINRITDATLKQKTGKVWQAWFAVLDTADVRELTHRQIVDYLSDKHQLDA